MPKGGHKLGQSGTDRKDLAPSPTVNGCHLADALRLHTIAFTTLAAAAGEVLDSEGDVIIMGGYDWNDWKRIRYY